MVCNYQFQETWIHITDHDDSQVLNACIKGVSPTFEVKCTQSTTQLMNFSSWFYIKFWYKQGKQIMVCNYHFQETRQEVSKNYTVVIKVVSLMFHCHFSHSYLLATMRLILFFFMISTLPIKFKFIQKPVLTTFVILCQWKGSGESNLVYQNSADKPMVSHYADSWKGWCEWFTLQYNKLSKGCLKCWSLIVVSVELQIVE